MVDIMDGSKRALERAQLNATSMPKFAELFMKRLIPQIATDSEVMLYLPDKAFMAGRLDKIFVITVLATARPGFVEQVVDYALKVRSDLPKKEAGKSVINLLPRFQQALCNTTFINCKFLIFNMTTNSLIVRRGKRGKRLRGLKPFLP